MKTVLVLALATLSVAVGESLLSSGMKQIGDVSAAGAGGAWRMLGMLTNPRVILGTAFMAGFYFLFSATLSWSDLSYAQPITALSFVFALVIARLFLGEQVSAWRWVGTALITAGVVLVTMDTRELTVPTAAGGADAVGGERPGP